MRKSVDGRHDDAVEGGVVEADVARMTTEDIRRAAQARVDAATAEQERKRPTPPPVLGARAPDGASSSDITALYRAACKKVGVQPHVGMARPPEYPSLSSLDAAGVSADGDKLSPLPRRRRRQPKDNPEGEPERNQNLLRKLFVSPPTLCRINLR